MIPKEEAEKIIRLNLKEDRLQTIIRNTSHVAWNYVISEEDVNRWLNNFRGMYFSDIDCEKKLALWMLAHYTFYTEADLRHLCRKMYGTILHKKIEEYGGEKTIVEVVREVTENSIFCSFGNISESGNNILYFFRQENNLPQTCFEIDEKKKYKNIFMMDDVSLSATQAGNYISANGIKADHKYACFLIATNKARGRLSKAHRDVKVLDVIELDERDKAFSKESYVFNDSRVKDLEEHAKEFCKTYGKVAVKGADSMECFPLGYKDGQYMFGFAHNTPDNTLPIFWGDNNEWTPLFKRYHKKYGEGVTLDVRKFY